MFLAERFYLHIHARRQIELHQCVHRLLRRLENIEQALVRPDLKLFAEPSCDSVRIISLRKADHEERKEYEKAIQDRLEKG